MGEKNKQVAVSGKSQPMSIEMLIQQAIERGTPVDTMERLLAMRKELKAEKAKEGFDKAMADFQQECPVIAKKRKVTANSGGGYSYAPLESIVEQVKEILHKHGFSYSIQTRTENKVGVTAICMAKHVGGHSEPSEMTVPLGTKTNMMSDTQVVAAAITFAKRYAFCNAFGILTGDADTNGPTASSDGNPRAEHDKAATRMGACKSLDALNTTWRSLPAKLRSDDELIALGKEIKKAKGWK